MVTPPGGLGRSAGFLRGGHASHMDGSGPWMAGSRRNARWANHNVHDSPGLIHLWASWSAVVALIF